MNIINSPDTLSVVTSDNRIVPIPVTTISDTNLLEKYSMNEITVDHKVQEQELIKLKEVAPDYANDIKNNIAKRLSETISNKVSYTKKHDIDAAVHHFIGRVWVFNKEELIQLIKEAQNAK
jgi:hypothetical protein